MGQCTHFLRRATGRSKLEVGSDVLIRSFDKRANGGPNNKR